MKTVEPRMDADKRRLNRQGAKVLRHVQTQRFKAVEARITVEVEPFSDEEIMRAALGIEGLEWFRPVTGVYCEILVEAA